MNVKEIGLEDVNWITLAGDRSQWRTHLKGVLKLRLR
jgi:hypothetical protein